MTQRPRRRGEGGGFAWATVGILLVATRVVVAEGVARTESLVEAGRPGSHPGAVAIEGQEVDVDLDALPGEARVLRATLHLRRDSSVERGSDPSVLEPIRVVALSAETDAVPLPLQLRPPRYRSFDATRAVEAALKGGGVDSDPTIRFRVDRLAGFRREGARLDVTFEHSGDETTAPPPAPRAGARDLRAGHIEGRTFLVWSQPDHGLGSPDASVQDLRRAIEEDASGSEVRYRIYRSAQPISASTLSFAELVDEVDGFTAWNDEFHGAHVKPEQPALRYVVRDGDSPVPPGTGVYVHAPSKSGAAWYAVVQARDGAESIAEVETLRAAVGPIEETVGPGRPVLQRVVRPEEFQYVRQPTLEYYVRWECPPTANLPSRPFDYLVGIPAKPRDPRPLCIALHCWGGSLEGGYGWWYGAGDGAMLVATNQIPYDWWACYHESLGTWKPLSEGTAQSYTPKRLWSFVDWMRHRWMIDDDRVFLGGASMGGSGVSHWIRYGDRVAYGISWVGVHIPSESPQFRGSYENVVGKVEWDLPHESGLPVWSYLDDARFLRENPATETPFLAYSNGKNDGAIGWKQAVRFTRALQETRRPHLFVWGQAGHGQRAYFPTPEGGGDNVRGGLDVRLDRSLPAFTRCSLDDDPGDGDPAVGDPEGQLNRYLRWDTESIVDEGSRWSATVYLIDDAPKSEATTDVTPRRCRSFHPRAGDVVRWSLVERTTGDSLGAGKVTADRWGLVTVEDIPVAKGRRQLEIRTGEVRSGR